MNKDYIEVELKKNERYTLEENKVKLYIKAKGRAAVIRVDDGIISKKKLQNQKACDYLVYNLADNLSHFVELKGSDLTHALKQILDTIIFLENDKSNSKYIKDADVVRGYVVSNSGVIPAIDHSDRKKLSRKLNSISKIKLCFNEYVVFVRCVSKKEKIKEQNIGGAVLNNNNFPLIV